MSDDSGVNARLVLMLEARLSTFEKALEKASKKTDDEAGKIERRAKQMATEVERTTSRAVLSNHIATQFGQLHEKAQSAGRSVPVLGAQLAGLGAAAGPAGVALGVVLTAVGALSIALEKGKQAAEWAEGLEKASKKLGVTTEQLQVFDYVIAKTGGNVAEARGEIAEFNAVLGKFQSGVGDKKIASYLAGFGITREEAQNWNGLADALPRLKQAFDGLGTAAQRADFVNRLHLPVKLLKADLPGAAAEMRKFGFMIDEAAVRKGAIAAKQLKANAAIIDGELRAAYMNLTPLVAASADAGARAAEMFAKLTRSVAGLAGEVGDALGVLRPFWSYIDRISQGSGKTKVKGGTLGNIAEAVLNQFAPGTGTLARAGLHAVAAEGKFQNLAGDVRDIMAGKSPSLRDRAALEYEAEQVRKHHSSGYTAPTGGGKGKGGSSPSGPNPEQVAKASEDALAQAFRNVLEAGKAELAAQLELTGDIEARTRIQLELLRLANDEKAEALDKATADAQHNAALGKITAAAARQIGLDNEAAKTMGARNLALEEQKLLRDKDNEIARRDLERRHEIDAVYDQIAQATISMARTAAERRDLELKSLAERRRQEERDLRARRKEAVNNNDPAETKHVDALIAALPDKYGSQRTQVLRDTMGPWERWKDSGIKSAAEVEEALQQAKVDGIDAFNESLFDSEGHLNSLGNVFHSVFTRMLKDLEQLVLKMAENELFGGGGGGGAGGFFSSLLGMAGGLFGSNTPGFGLVANAITQSGSAAGWAALEGHANGADSFGGLTRINERGTEGVAFLPPNTQIIPNDVLRGLANIDPSRMGGRGGDVRVTFAPVYQVQGYGPDIAALQMQMAQDKATFENRVVTAVRKASRSTH